MKPHPPYSQDHAHYSRVKELATSHATLCYAMPCHAMPSHATPCHAMPCHVKPCHAMPYHATLYHTTPRYAMLCQPCHAMPYHATLCHAMPRYATLCHAMPYHAMLCHAMPCHAMPRYAMLCHTTPRYAMLCQPRYATLCYAMPCHAMPRHATPHQSWFFHSLAHEDKCTAGMLNLCLRNFKSTFLPNFHIYSYDVWGGKREKEIWLTAESELPWDSCWRINTVSHAAVQSVSTAVHVADHNLTWNGSGWWSACNYYS